jgi:DNA invertase Pin-like site-specific DNA recombinase
MELWGYLVPTDRENDGHLRLALEDERAIREYAAVAKPRTKLVNVFHERLAAASVPFLQRPQAKELLAIVQRRDGIVVPSLDVFASALDCHRTLAACRLKGLRLFVARIGDIATNRLALAIVAGFADLERARKRERTLTGQASRRAAARRVSGTRPFGYVVLQDGYLREQPDEQRAIGRMRELRREGKSFRAIRAAIAKEFGSSPSAFGVQRIVDNKRKLNEEAIRQRVTEGRPGQPSKKTFNRIGPPRGDEK